MSRSPPLALFRSVSTDEVDYYARRAHPTCHLSLLKLNFRSRTQAEKNVVQEAEKKNVDTQCGSNA
jgi:hypothetical protein